MQETLSKTYTEVAIEWFAKLSADNENLKEDSDYYQGIREFALYLDSFQTLDSKLQLLAMQKAREIDREVMFAMCEKLGKEETENIIKEVYKKHRHS